MRSAQLSVVAAALAVAACGTSHPPSGPCTTAGCPSGDVCMTNARYVDGVCVPRCVPATERRCENGAFCTTRRSVDHCSPGEFTPEGGEAVTDSSCAFGLRPRDHYEDDPLRRTCEPVCNTDADCRAGEVCSGGCAPPCEGPDAVPCDPEDHCVRGYCVNQRRFDRIDCDGDGDADCFPALTCDAAAVGGCSHPPREEL